LGGPIGEWIALNDNMGWRWLFILNIILGGVFSFLMIFIPETLPSVVIANYGLKTGDPEAMVVANGRKELSVMAEIKFVTTMAIKILCTEPIIIALGLANGFAYGILFLTLDGLFPIFAFNYGLSDIATELTYLCFAVGVIIVFAYYPVQNWLFKRDMRKNGGRPRPEARFLTSLVTIWGFVVGLFWAGGTSENTTTSFWSPVIAFTVVGIADPLAWLAMLNYITDSYPSYAASAIAAFTLPSFVIAGTMAHAGVALFDGNLSTAWALYILGFISIALVAVIYSLYFYGRILRARSPLCAETTLQD